MRWAIPGLLSTFSKEELLCVGKISSSSARAYSWSCQAAEGAEVVAGWLHKAGWTHNQNPLLGLGQNPLLQRACPPFSTEPRMGLSARRIMIKKQKGSPPGIKPIRILRISGDLMRLTPIKRMLISNWHRIRGAPSVALILINSVISGKRHRVRGSPSGWLITASRKLTLCLTRVKSPKPFSATALLVFYCLVRVMARRLPASSSPNPTLGSRVAFTGLPGVPILKWLLFDWAIPQNQECPISRPPHPR